MSIQIKFPDGAVREYDSGTTTEAIAESISPGLKKNAVAGKVDGKVVDIYAPIHTDASVEIITLDSKDGLEVYRHSSAHLLAQALKRIYGHERVKLGIGPVIEDGFYYDIDLDESDYPRGFSRNREGHGEDYPRELIDTYVKRLLAKRLFRYSRELNDPLKLELIRDLPEDSVITIYEQGEFFDLCRGRIYLLRAGLKLSNC